jgi:hypothetical protein
VILILLQMLAGMATLAPAVVTYVIIEGDVPLTQAEFEELAFQQGRQCWNGVGQTAWTPPERCALVEDHYGRCEA